MSSPKKWPPVTNISTFPLIIYSEHYEDCSLITSIFQLLTLWKLDILDIIWSSIFYGSALNSYEMSLQKFTCKCGVWHPLLEKGNLVVNFTFSAQLINCPGMYPFWLVTWSHICIILHIIEGAYITPLKIPQGRRKIGSISIMLHVLCSHFDLT